MAAKKRNSAQIKSDRLTISDLRLKGYTEREIAAQLKTSQQMVHYDLKVVELEWKASRNEEIDKQKSRELAILNKLYSEAMKQFDLLKDPRYLQAAIQCSRDRRELMGLDAPKETRHSGFVGAFDPSKCSMEQIERIVNGEDPGLVLSNSNN